MDLTYAIYKIHIHIPSYIFIRNHYKLHLIQIYQTYLTDNFQNLFL
jgi:hypothetical protein